MPDGDEGGAFKPMIRFVTLLTVADIGFASNGAASSTGDARGFSPEELFFPNPNFHFDTFFVTTGGAGMIGTGGGASKGKSARCFDDDREALLISRAKDWEAVARVSRVSSIGDPGLVGWVGTPEPLPFLAPRLRRLWADVEREYIPSKS